MVGNTEEPFNTEQIKTIILNAFSDQKNNLSFVITFTHLINVYASFKNDIKELVKPFILNLVEYIRNIDLFTHDISKLISSGLAEISSKQIIDLYYIAPLLIDKLSLIDKMNYLMRNLYSFDVLSQDQINKTYAPLPEDKKISAIKSMLKSVNPSFGYNPHTGAYEFETFSEEQKINKLKTLEKLIPLPFFINDLAQQKTLLTEIENSINSIELEGSNTYKETLLKKLQQESMTKASKIKN